jgi:hypothetical protein
MGKFFRVCSVVGGPGIRLVIVALLIRIILLDEQRRPAINATPAPKPVAAISPAPVETGVPPWKDWKPIHVPFGEFGHSEGVAAAPNSRSIVRSPVSANLPPGGIYMSIPDHTGKNNLLCLHLAPTEKGSTTVVIPCSQMPR